MKTYAGIALAILMGATGAVGGMFGAKAHFDKKNTETVQVKDGEISELSTKLAELQKALSAKEEELVFLKIEHKALQDQKEQNEELIVSLEIEIATKEASLAEARTQFSEFQATFNELQENYNNLEIENSVNEEQVNSLTGQMALLNERISALENALAEEQDPNKDYLYEYLQNSITKYFFPVQDGTILVSFGGSSKPGLYLLQPDYTLTQVSEASYGWNYKYALSDGRIAFVKSGSLGVLVYSPSTATATLYDTTMRSFDSVGLLSESLLFVSHASYGTDIINLETRELSHIDQSVSSCLCDLKNDTYLVRKSSNFFLLSTKDGSIENVQSPTIQNSIYASKVLNNGDALFSTGGAGGLYYYDAINKEITLLDSTYSYIDIYFETSQGDVFISKTQTANSIGIVLFDLETKTFQTLQGWHNNWDTYVEDENGVTISSAGYSSYGKYYYNYVEGTLTEITNS